MKQANNLECAMCPFPSKPINMLVEFGNKWAHEKGCSKFTKHEKSGFMRACTKCLTKNKGYVIT